MTFPPPPEEAAEHGAEHPSSIDPDPDETDWPPEEDG